MAVRVRCTCGYRIRLADQWRGRQGRCPSCGSVLEIPARSRWWPWARKARPDIASSSRAASRALSRRIRERPVWVAAMLCGILLLVSGTVLLWIPTSDSASQSTRTYPAQQHVPPPPGKTGTGVFRPKIAERDGEREPPSLPGIGSGASSASMREANKITTSPHALALDPWNLDEFGMVIPSDAEMIEIDGVRLPVGEVGKLVRGAHLPLVLPRGSHQVRFRSDERARLVEPRRWFLEAYRAAESQVQEDGRWSFDRLMQVSKRVLDRFADPLMPHFWGNYYWQEGQLDAAARQYRWALRIAPTFAPSYFNLAQLELERGNESAAHRYLLLADLWNAQNAYGLSFASAALWSRLGGGGAPASGGPAWLVPRDDEMTERDQDMMAVLRSAASFATRLTERVKILNNMGAYFEHVGKPELALEQYRAAVMALDTTQPGAEGRRILRGVFQNMARVCRQAGMAEYRRYERMQAMLGS